MLWHFDTGVGLAGPWGQGFLNPEAIWRGLGRLSADTDRDWRKGAISLIRGIVGDQMPVIGVPGPLAVSPLGGAVAFDPAEMFRVTLCGCRTNGRMVTSDMTLEVHFVIPTRMAQYRWIFLDPVQLVKPKIKNWKNWPIFSKNKHDSLWQVLEHLG